MRKRMIALFLCAAMFPSVLACCGKRPEPSVDESDGATAVSAEIQGTPESTGSSEQGTDAPNPPADSKQVVEVKWNFGYIGSATNPNNPNKIAANGTHYSYTDVIELGPKGTKVTFTDTKNGTTSSNAYVVSSWKKEGNEWVIDLEGANIAGQNTIVFTRSSAGTTYSYISTLDNECIRLCYRSEQRSADDVVEYPVIYRSQTDEPGTVADQLSFRDWLRLDKERAFYDLLKGKTINFIGDSYFDGHGLDKSLVWPALLATKYDMEYKNYGIGGSTISNYVTTNNPMVDRYQNMANNNPDIVVVDGGRNDYNQSVPMGVDDVTDRNTKTMKGALRDLLYNLQEKYPDALIICVTVWEVGGTKKTTDDGSYSCSDYGRAMISVCESMGIPYINAMDSDDIGVKMTSSSFRLKYCMTAGDISHLNFEGMKLALPAFERHIAQIYESYLQSKNGQN